MDHHLEPLTENDRKSVIDIFNYYIENSFAAYPENKVGYAFFDHFLRMADGYPAFSVKNQGGETIGFGLIHSYHPFPTFRRAAEVSYFIQPSETGKGIGGALLDTLIENGKKRGIETVLANICSFNDRSIRFHSEHGFVESGRLKGVGRKFGQTFDVIWMQRDI